MLPALRPLPCPFCPPEAAVVAESTAAVAVRDGFPVAEGHTLVIPRRHVGSVFELGPDELADFFALVARVRAQLAADFAPDGFTIGINDGEAEKSTSESARKAHWESSAAVWNCSTASSANGLHWR